MAAICVAASAAIVSADPTLPTIGPPVIDPTVSNPSVDGGSVFSTTSDAADNKTVLNAFIKYASSLTTTVNGQTVMGGTIAIPAGTYTTNEITLQNNVNLNLAAGSELLNSSYGNTLIDANSGASNIEISGSGIIDGAATTLTSGTNLVVLNHVSNLEITGVSIDDSSHEHLVVETSNNVTINGITIADPAAVADGGYLKNTDGIDYSGSNFLIENSNISDGDDDIVEKPSSVLASNILIQGDSIGAGHGISIGGGTAGGVQNFVVNNISFNGTGTGLRIKAEDVTNNNEDAGGGTTNPVNGITYSNITMKNVTTPIVIESFYNGNDIFPNSPTNRTYYPSTAVAQDSGTPDYDNILFENISATGASMAGYIEGLNTSPASIDGVVFENVNIQANAQMNLWYATNVDTSGLTVTVPTNNPYYAVTAMNPVSGVWEYDVTVPEPASLAIGSLGYLLLLRRRRDS